MSAAKSVVSSRLVRPILEVVWIAVKSRMLRLNNGYEPYHYYEPLILQVEPNLSSVEPSLDSASFSPPPESDQASRQYLFPSSPNLGSAISYDNHTDNL